MIKIVNATTISDAWFQLIRGVFEQGYKTEIQSGSFENEQYRLQYEGITVSISHPDQDMYPVIPAHYNLPPVSSKETVEDYFANYIMDPTLAENETYKYSSRINKKVKKESCPDSYITAIDDCPTCKGEGVIWKTQLEVVIEMLKKTPLTNQAIIEIAEPKDVVACVGNDGKLDPPCLRSIDFKVIPTAPNEPCCGGNPELSGQGTAYPCLNGEFCPDVDKVLTMSVYFRSWDLWAGFPVNLGGLELLKQYVAGECGLINGPMYAYSAGAHIYGYQEKMAKIRAFGLKEE